MLIAVLAIAMGSLSVTTSVHTALHAIDDQDAYAALDLTSNRPTL